MIHDGEIGEYVGDTEGYMMVRCTDGEHALDGEAYGLVVMFGMDGVLTCGSPSENQMPREVAARLLRDLADRLDRLAVGNGGG